MTAAPDVAARAAGLVPRRLLIGDNPPAYRRLTGTILFADVVGFTHLTEVAYRRHGARGIEELTQRLNAVFAAMVDAVHACRGDVLKFGGDALLIAFDDDSGPADHTLSRAVWCADRLRRAIRHSDARGGRGLSLHLGLASGPWEEYLVGLPGERREHFVTGWAIQEAIKAAATAVGSLGRWHTCAGFQPNDTAVEFRRHRRGQWTFTLPRRPWQGDFAPGATLAEFPTGLWDFVPTLLRDQLRQPGFDPLRAAEHRRSSTLFAFWRTRSADQAAGDPVALWRDVFSLAYESSRLTDGLWARSDPGEGYQKLLILFGTPTSREDDIERALDCALRLRDGFVRLRRQYRGLRAGIGLTTATVFTGYVGGPRRHEFTAMGNGINLAARLAAKAPAGTVLVERLTHHAAPGFHFTPGPQLVLKGIAGPITTFRPQERRAPSTHLDDDEIVEHPRALEASLRQWEEAPPRPLGIDVHPEADGRRFVIQLLSRLEVRQATVLHLRFEQADGFHPHGGLRRFLLLLAGCAGSEQLQARLASAEHRDTWEALAPVFSPESALARELARAGLESTSGRIATLISGCAPALVGDHHIRLIVLEHTQHLSDLDRDVLARLASLARQTWRFIIARQVGAGAVPTVGDAVTLGPMTKPELREFVQRVLPRGSLSAPLLDFLYERSGGMARLARLYLESLQEGGFLIEPRGERGLWRLERAAAAELPGGLRAHYIQRIDRLPPAAGIVARALAVVGESAPWDAVRQLCQSSLSDQDFAEGIDTLKRSGLTEATGGSGEPNLAFTDQGCRQAVYETLSYAAREEWHRQAARYWRARGSLGAPLVGEHLFRARDPAALPFLEQAARRARRLWLLDHARVMSRWALLAATGRCDPEYSRTVPPWPAAPTQRERRLLELLAGVLQIQSQYTDAARIWRHLAVEARRLGDTMAECRHRLASARVDWHAGRYRQARRQSRHVLHLAGRSPDPRVTGQAHFLVGETARRTGQMESARSALTTAIDHFSRARDRARAADAWNALGLVHWQCGRLDEARRCFQTALRLGGYSRDPAKRAQIANNLGILLEESGRLRAAERYYRKAFTLFDRLGARRNRAYSLGNLANLYRHGARYESARAAYEDVELELRSISETHAAAYTTGNLGDLARDFGDWPSAIALYQSTLRFARNVGDAELLAESYSRLAQVRLWQGRQTDAIRLLRQARGAARKAESREFAIRAGLLRAEIDLATADCHSALDLFTDLHRDAEAAGLVYYQLWAQYDIGGCQLRHGDYRAALRTSSRGMTRARRSGYRWWELHFAVLGAGARSGSARGGNVAEPMSTRLRARALTLKTEIESSIGDPKVRASFAQLPLIRRLMTLAPVPRTSIPA